MIYFILSLINDFKLPYFLVSVELSNIDFNVKAAKTAHFFAIKHLNSHLVLAVGVDGLWWI